MDATTEPRPAAPPRPYPQSQQQQQQQPLLPPPPPRNPHRVLTTEEELQLLEQERNSIMHESSQLLDSHGVHDSVRNAFQVEDSFLYEEDNIEVDLHELSDNEVIESLSPERARPPPSQLHNALVQLYQDFSSGLSMSAVTREKDTSIVLERGGEELARTLTEVQQNTATFRTSKAPMDPRTTNNVAMVPHHYHQKPSKHFKKSKKSRHARHSKKKRKSLSSSSSSSFSSASSASSSSAGTSDSDSENNHYTSKHRKKQKKRKQKTKVKQPQENEPQKNISTTETKRVRFQCAPHRNNVSTTTESNIEPAQMTPDPVKIDNGEGVAPPGPQSTLPHSPVKMAAPNTSSLLSHHEEGQKRKHTTDMPFQSSSEKIEQDIKIEEKTTDPLHQPRSSSPLTPPQRKNAVPTTLLPSSTNASTESPLTFPTPEATKNHAVVAAASPTFATTNFEPTSTLNALTPPVRNAISFARKTLDSPQRAPSLPSPQTKTEETMDMEKEEEESVNNEGENKEAGTGGSDNTPLFVEGEDGSGPLQALTAPLAPLAINSGTTGDPFEGSLPTAEGSSGGSTHTEHMAGDDDEGNGSNGQQQMAAVALNASGGGGTISEGISVEPEEEEDETQEEDNGEETQEEDGAEETLEETQDEAHNEAHDEAHDEAQQEQSVEQPSEEDTATTEDNMFEIDMASVLAGVQQIIMRRIFDELPCDQTNSVRVRVRDGFCCCRENCLN